MENVIRRCDECYLPFEIRADIAVDVDAWAAQGEPYVCDDCLSDDLHEDCVEIEDEIDRMAERFPNGSDVVSIECSNCHESTNVPEGELLVCMCGNILKAMRVAKSKTGMQSLGIGSSHD